MQIKNITNRSRQDHCKIIPVRAILIISAILLFIASTGCSKINMELFGIKLGEEENAPPELALDGDTLGESDDNGKIDEPEAIEEPAPGPDDPTIEPGTADEIIYYEDIEELRLYYSEAMNAFQDESYLIAEYYLNRINGRYMILQDHIFYYLAKSLLLQEKFDQSEEYYLKIIQDFPDSIWLE